MEKTIAEYQTEIESALIRLHWLQDEIDWLNNDIHERRKKIKNLEFIQLLDEHRAGL